MFSIKNLLKLNPIRSTIIITSCLISSLLTVFVRYNLTWQADLLKENNIQGFLYLSLISLIAYILSSILSNFGNYFLLTKSVQEYLHSIRGAMLKRYSNNIDSSKVQNDLINNLETAGNQYLFLVAALLEYIFLFIFSVVAISSLNWIIVLSTLILALILLKLPDMFKNVVGKTSIANSEQTQKFLADISNWTRGLDVLHRFNLRDVYLSKLNSAGTSYTKVYLKNVKINKNVSLIVVLSNVIAQLLISALTGMLILHNKLSIGAFFSIGGLIGYTFSYVVIISNGLVQMKNGKAIVDQINSQLEEPLFHEKAEKNYKDVKYLISNLSKNFSSMTKIIYPDIEINQGDKILLTGPSGIGKSTLFKLILGELTPTSGSIVAVDKDGQKHKIIRNQIGYISQEPVLMPASIIDNITMFNPNMKKKALNIIDKVKLKKDILNFKDGINTIVTTDKSNISGGQKQKIVLARTLLYNKPLILVDEATSAIDARNAKEILRTVTKVDATVIVIAHNLTNDTRRLFDKEIKLSDQNV